MEKRYHKKTISFLLVVVAMLSLFATCRKSGEVATEDDLGVLKDSMELEFEPIDDDSEAPQPTKLSLNTKGNFSFSRNLNTHKQGYFRNPFDSAIYVSGTFCELRGNHFHGGLDIRTGGRQGWPVLAAADGYVERIKVSTGGYGKAIYIRHPNGYTTVYGHLKSFKGALANYVKDAQYKQRKVEIELYPKAGALKLKKGENFALSGNTGGSGGPHLHFEIRDRRGRATNPLLHGLDVKDDMRPVIKKISVYEKEKESLYASGDYPYMTFNQWSDYLKNTKTLNLKPGAYSFGLYTDDYFTDKQNVLGINYCWLTANGSLVYQYQIEDFDFTQGRYIYTHTDPYLKWKEKKTYIRLFKEKFNPLPYYKQRNQGEVHLKHGDSVQMKLYIEDYAGYKDSATWIIVGDTTGKKLKITNNVAAEKIERVETSKRIKYYEWDITVPQKAVYHPFDFKLGINPKRPNMLSKTLQMHYGYTPLHTYMNIRYTVPQEWLKYGSKLCAVSFSGKRTFYEGGTLSGNVLSFKSRSLGEYAITYDDTKPTIRVVSFGKNWKFKVADNLSGVKTVRCSLDGKWLLYDYEPKTTSVWGEIPAWIKPGSHDFRIEVTDYKGNKEVYERKMTL